MHPIEKRMDATSLRRLRGPPAAHFGLETDTELQRSVSQSVGQSSRPLCCFRGNTRARHKEERRPSSSHLAIDPSLFTRRGRRKMHEKRIALLPPWPWRAHADWGNFSSTSRGQPLRDVFWEKFVLGVQRSSTKNPMTISS